ncbi:MAG: DNA metabolism protein [Chitinophagaceae bacterium]|nr:MAG: DNA metabolism protein [Chitinophagaceae bacterium]
MASYVYDHSFEGLLSAVFEVYVFKDADARIYPEGQAQDELFMDTRRIEADPHRAGRVWKKLATRLSKTDLRKFCYAFLSGEKGMEMFLLFYIRHVLGPVPNAENDYGHPAVKYVTDMARKVHREKHRMEAFIRFRLSDDGLYFAEIEPDFNVLPLLRKHFQSRYADQRWMIYDSRRGYGLYYDLEKVESVSMSGEASAPVELNETEKAFQRLWGHYFTHVNIKERKNTKLHLRHMPRRYWKFLTEKTIGLE